MKKKYLNFIPIIVILAIASIFLFSKKNPKLIFTAQTNKEIYYPHDPIYFNLIIKNVSDEYQNIKRENYPEIITVGISLNQ